MNKSVSESEVSLMGNDDNKTPPNYVFRRAKRSREDISIGEQLEDFKREIKEMMDLFLASQKNETHQVSTTLKEIQQSNVNIENTITILMSQNQDLEKKILKLENQSKEDKTYITLLENKIEEIETGSRKANFVLKNVPKIVNESKQDLIDVVLTLSQNINCSMTKYDIKDVYRVRGKNNENQKMPIVVETGSTLLKNEIMKSGKYFNIKNKSKLCCKHLGFKTQEDSPIFLSEHLTPKGSRLYFLARDLIKSGAYKYCWTAYGRVYVKKEDLAPTISIRSEEQIHQLLVKI